MQEVRVRIVMTDEQMAALEHLVKDAGCVDVPHLVNRSIAVLSWIISEKREGRKVGAIKFRDDGEIEDIHYPQFTLVKKKQDV